VNYAHPYQMQPFAYRPYMAPKSPDQFVSGLLPLSGVINSLKTSGTISPTTAASAKLPVGWLIALGGAYWAFSAARTRSGLAIGVALAMLAGEAVYEILDGIAGGATTPATTPAAQ
jgi:hypothetical protein